MAMNTEKPQSEPEPVIEVHRTEVTVKVNPDAKIKKESPGQPSETPTIERPTDK